MNILHVLSQFEVTGAEAYATSLIEEQAKQGHTIFLVSDTLTLPIKGTYLPVPIGKRSYLRRLRNITALVRLIRGNNISIVHAHSRAASWVAFFATAITKTPFVSTVHGRQHVHPSSQVFNIYGRNIIAVCESVRDHLITDLRIQPRDVTVIPNCIPMNRWEELGTVSSALEATDARRDQKVVMFLGRLTGPKGDVVRFLLKFVVPVVLQRHPVVFAVVGGMITPNDIPELADSVNSAMGQTTVVLKGFRADIGSIAELIASADVVIGSGRVVPETLALKKPSIAFGEASYVGPVTAESFAEAASTNFGDSGSPEDADPNIVAFDLLRILEHPLTQLEREEVLALAHQRFDAEVVAAKIHDAYKLAYARAHSPSMIPVLMYHRVVDHPPAGSSHGIWVTASRFAAQLRSLRSRGFETITFRDYQEFMRGARPLPRRPIVLTFDDGYVDNYMVAFPLLRQYGARAVIYAVTDPHRRTNFWDPDEPQAELLSADQLRELARHGMEIGSHTITHPNLTTLTDELIQKELRESKEYLEEVISAEVLSLAYPYGALNAKVKQFAAAAGYEFAVAGDSGPLAFADDYREIRRTQVFPWTGSFGFWKKTLPFYQRYRLIKH